MLNACRDSAVVVEEPTACATLVDPSLPAPPLEAAGEADARASAATLVVLQVGALTYGEVLIQFSHALEDRHAWQRLHDLEDFLNLRLHVDE